MEAKATEIDKLISKSYQMCSKDPDIALSYAALLESKLQTEAAKNVLLKLASENEYYNTEIDIRLMLYYLDQKDLENVKIYLKKSKKNYLYLTEQNQKAINYVEQSLSKKTTNSIFRYLNFFTLNGIVFVSFIILAMTIFLKKYLKKKNTNTST